MNRSKWNALALALLAMTALAGCGRGGNEFGATGQANGSVTFNGNPLPEGVVNFYNKTTGLGATAKVVDGAFEITEPIVAGEYEVSILPPAEEPPQADAPPRPVRSYEDIPVRYRAGETSKLVAKIEKGENTLKFEMVP